MNTTSKIYIIATLSISWAATFLFSFFGVLMQTVPLIMLVPALVAIVMRISQQGFTLNIFKNPNAKGLSKFLKALLFAVIYPVVIVSICALVGATLYGQKIDTQFIQNLLSYKQLINFVIMAGLSFSTIFAFGEEFGWRAFLLPELCKTNTKVKSSTIVGVVWAFYHFPVMVLLNMNLGIKKALLLAIVQGTAAFVFSYAFSYCYFISNRVYPAVVMHGFWNIYNPFVLGSIYSGNSGTVLFKGPVFITNGEGIFGIVAGSFAAILFVYLMKRMSTLKTQE